MTGKFKRFLSSHPDLLWAFFIFVAALVVLLPDLGQGFWDAWEPHYSRVSREMLEAGDWLYPTYQGHSEFSKPIFLYWFELIGFSLFGVTEWAARLLVALSGAATAVYTFWCVRILLGRTAGIVSALILLGTPMFPMIFRQVMFDGPFVAASWCGLLSFAVGILVRRRFVYFAVFYILAAVAVLSKGLLGLAIPLGVIGLYVLITYDFRLLGRVYLVRGLMLFMLVGLPWYLYMFHRFGQTFIDEFIIENHFRRLLGETKLIRNVLGTFEYYINNIGYSLFPLSAVLPFAIGKFMPLEGMRPRRVRARLFIMLSAFVPFFIITVTETKFNHYHFPMVPPLAVMLAWYGVTTFRRARTDGLPIGFRAEIVLSLALLAVMTLDLTRNFREIIELSNFYVDRPIPESFSLKTPILFAAGATGLGLLIAVVRPSIPQLLKTASGLPLAAGLVFTWYLAHPVFVELSPHFTMKQIYDRYDELRGPDDRLGEFSKWYRGTIFYCKTPYERVQRGDTPMREFLKGPGKRFLVTGREDYDLLTRTLNAVTKRSWRIVDDSSARFYLIMVDEGHGADKGEGGASPEESP